MKVTTTNKTTRTSRPIHIGMHEKALKQTYETTLQVILFIKTSLSKTPSPDGSCLKNSTSHFQTRNITMVSQDNASKIQRLFNSRLNYDLTYRAGRELTPPLVGLNL